MKSIFLKICAGALLLTACSKAPLGPSAPSAEMAENICKIVKQFAATGGKSSFLQPDGELAMAFANAYQNDPKQLHEVLELVEPVTQQSCAADRTAALAILKTHTLREAIQ
jgi:hypothetical protein